MDKTWNSKEPSQQWLASTTQHQRLVCEVTNKARTTYKELRVSLTSVTFSVDSSIRNTLSDNGIHGTVQMRKLLLTKKNTKVHLIFGFTRQNVSAVASGMKLPQRQTVMVVVWWSGPALLLHDLDDLKEPWIIQDFPEGKCLTISLFPEAHEHLGFAKGL